MKKILCSLLALLLALTLFGCDKKDPSPNTVPEGGESAVEAEDEGEKEAEPQEDDAAASPDALLAFDGPHIEVADYELGRFLRLAGYLNNYAEEFSEVGELSDMAKFFAAAAYLDGSFLTLEDGYSYSIDMAERPPAVKRVYGPDAALSGGWQAGSYEPYVVDAASSSVLKYSAGQSTRLFFTYACIPLEDGWELWLLDLFDPLFSAANPGALEYGEAMTVQWDMVAPYASEMQTNIYTIKLNLSGEPYIAGFRYRNYKDIAHEIY